MAERTLRLWIVGIGSTILAVLSLSIVLGVVYAALFQGAVPDELANWGGLIVGFYIGSFFSTVRTILGVRDDN